MHFIESDLLKKTFCFCKLLLCFPREANDHICGDGRIFKETAQDLYTLIVFPCRIFPIHALQHTITAALQGKMKMGTEFVHLCKPLCKLPGNDPGLQRAKADPLDPFCLLDLTDQGKQSVAGKILSLSHIGPAIQIKTIGADMDPGQHHFLIAVSCKCPDLLKDLFHLSASDSSPCIGNNAIGTELVAAILNLDIGTLMLCRPL